jgi:hypothetical protein
MTQQYSWPGPVPPWGRKGTVTFIRCAQCRGSLFHTKLKNQPRQEDHEQGCVAYITAIRVMQYVDELNRAVSQPDQGAWRSTRRRRKYLRENAKKLSEAACEGDPAAKITALGDGYQAECEKRAMSAKVAEITEMAEMLMRACRQLALGRHPAPVIPGPGGLPGRGTGAAPSRYRRSRTGMAGRRPS